MSFLDIFDFRSASSIHRYQFGMETSFKRSGHEGMLEELNLLPEQTIYLEDYGHIGQIDQILSLHLALKTGQVTDGTVICMLAAGIGYVWAANIIRWG